MQTAPPHVAVAGSVNADLVFSLQRVPRAGETLAARGLAVHPGGKVLAAGAAAAAARAASVSRPSHFPLSHPPRFLPGRQPSGSGSTVGSRNQACGAARARCAGTHVSAKWRLLVGRQPQPGGDMAWRLVAGSAMVPALHAVSGTAGCEGHWTAMVWTRSWYGRWKVPAARPSSC